MKHLLSAVFVVVTSVIVHTQATGGRIATVPGAEFATVADMTHDGWEDVVFTSWDQGTLSIAINNHDGTFTPTTIATGLTKARNVEAARLLAGRTTPQLLVSAFEAGHFLFVLLSDVWIPFPIELRDYGPAGIASGQIAGDGLLDVVTATQGVAGAPGTLKVYENADSAVMLLRATLPITDPSSVAVVDVDGDGLNDVIAADVDGALWWRHLGGFSFDGPYALARGLRAASKVTAADINRDGMVDFVIAGHFTGVWFVDGRSRGSAVRIHAETGSYDLAAGFVTYPDDGAMDVAVISGYPTHGLRLLAGPTFTVIPLADGYLTGRSVVVADLLHNGQRQLVTTSYTLGTVDWWTIP